MKFLHWALKNEVSTKYVLNLSIWVKDSSIRGWGCDLMHSWKAGKLHVKKFYLYIMMHRGWRTNELFTGCIYLFPAFSIIKQHSNALLFMTAVCFFECIKVLLTFEFLQNKFGSYPMHFFLSSQEDREPSKTIKLHERNRWIAFITK